MPACILSFTHPPNLKSYSENQTWQLKKNQQIKLLEEQGRSCIFGTGLLQLANHYYYIKTFFVQNDVIYRLYRVLLTCI